MNGTLLPTGYIWKTPHSGDIISLVGRLNLARVQTILSAISWVVKVPRAIATYVMEHYELASALEIARFV